jgi:hypothetical protein
VTSLNRLRYSKALGEHQERSSATGAIGTLPSKFRVAYLKGARLWSASGKVERTRVSDFLVNLAQLRLVHRIMGKRSLEDDLNGIQSAKNWRREVSLLRPVQKAEIAYLLSFDAEHLERQQSWQKSRFAGLLDLSHQWSAAHPLAQDLEEAAC